MSSRNNRIKRFANIMPKSGCIIENLEVFDQDGKCYIRDHIKDPLEACINTIVSNDGSLKLVLNGLRNLSIKVEDGFLTITNR